MAIADMSRVRLYGLEKEREALLSELMRSGVVQIENAPDINEITTSAEEVTTQSKTSGEGAYLDDVVSVPSLLRHIGDQTEVLSSESQAQNALAAYEILSRYAPQKKPMFSSRRVLSKSQIEELLLERSHISENIRVIKAIEDDINELKAEENRINSRIEFVNPWIGIGIDLSVEQTKSVRIQAGTLPFAVSLSEISGKLAEKSPFSEIIQHSATKDLRYCLFIVHLSEEAGAFSILKDAGWNRLSFRDIPGIPDGIIEKCNKRLKGIEVEKQKLVASIVDMNHCRLDIESLHDALLMERDRKKAADQLVATNKVFVLWAFVPTDQVESLTKRLTQTFTCHLEAEEIPESETDIPVLVRSNGFTEAIRPVMDMYGTPSPREIDPNFLTLPFFAIFFGLIMSDAGYGLLLVGGSAFVLLRMQLEDSVRRFAKLVLFCGTATIFWGILFGGFFGIKFFADRPLWFSPTAEGGTERLMAWCLLFGIIHLYTGMGMKAANYIRRKQYFDALFDVGFPYIMFTGFAMTVCTNVPGLDITYTKPISDIGIYILVVGVLLVVATAGRKSKSLFGKVFGGLPKLYDIIGFLGDVLSYMRLLALSLAGGILAGLVNGMAGDLGSLVAKIIGGTILLLLGHGINIAMSVLGAFVHSCRLQYLEFFSKFLEGGGKPFRPFGPVTRYIIMKQEE